VPENVPDGKNSNAATRPLRVVIVGPSLRRLSGGQEIQANLLIRQWQNDAAIKAVFVPNDPPPPHWLGWVERIAYLRTLVRLPLYLAELWRATKDSDIVHVFSASHSSFLLAPMPAWLIARRLGKKALINYHSGKAGDHLRCSAVARAILRRTDAIVVPSAYLVQVFQEFGLKVRAVPNIVDSDQFFYRPRRSLQPLLLCTRNFEPCYGIDLVIRAFAEVKKTFENAHLRLVGKGTQENAIRRLVGELGVRDVEFAGPITRDRIRLFYAGADIFINASWVDNMPGSILESFASGLPVVTTSAGGIAYLVEHERTGLLCGTGDWQALARNVVRLLGDGALALRLTQNAYEQSSLYRWERVRTEWLNVYQTLQNSTEPYH
jgi:glycosyltransferase involved in cell wall biosynthesis